MSILDPLRQGTIAGQAVDVGHLARVDTIRGIKLLRQRHRYLYIFLDESRNLDFSENGTRYFSLTSITEERPFSSFNDLIELKYDLVEKGLDLEYFHASEDAQEKRDHVFAIIQSDLHGVRVDALIVEKHLVEPSLRKEERFYPEMLGLLLRQVLDKESLEEFPSVPTSLRQ